MIQIHSHSQHSDTCASLVTTMKSLTGTHINGTFDWMHYRANMPSLTVRHSGCREKTLFIFCCDDVSFFFSCHRLRSRSSINQLTPRCCVMAEGSSEASIHTPINKCNLQQPHWSLHFTHVIVLFLSLFPIKILFFDILICLSPLVGLLDCLKDELWHSEKSKTWKEFEDAF